MPPPPPLALLTPYSKMWRTWKIACNRDVTWGVLDALTPLMGAEGVFFPPPCSGGGGGGHPGDDNYNVKMALTAPRDPNLEPNYREDDNPANLPAFA